MIFLTPAVYGRCIDKSHSEKKSPSCLEESLAFLCISAMSFTLLLSPISPILVTLFVHNPLIHR